ncbi:MAG: hypothetical protein P8179_21530 [Candidatus Thiodiazotropha sp.]
MAVILLILGVTLLLVDVLGKDPIANFNKNTNTTVVSGTSIGREHLV